MSAWDAEAGNGTALYSTSLRRRGTFTRDADPAVLRWQRRRVDDFLSILEEQVAERAKRDDRRPVALRILLLPS